MTQLWRFGGFTFLLFSFLNISHSTNFFALKDQLTRAFQIGERSERFGPGSYEDKDFSLYSVQLSPELQQQDLIVEARMALLERGSEGELLLQAEQTKVHPNKDHSNFQTLVEGFQENMPIRALASRSVVLGLEAQAQGSPISHQINPNMEIFGNTPRGAGPTPNSLSFPAAEQERRLQTLYRELYAVMLAKKMMEHIDSRGANEQALLESIMQMLEANGKIGGNDLRRLMELYESNSGNVNISNLNQNDLIAFQAALNEIDQRIGRLEPHILVEVRNGISSNKDGSFKRRQYMSLDSFSSWLTIHQDDPPPQTSQNRSNSSQGESVEVVLMSSEERTAEEEEAWEKEKRMIGVPRTNHIMFLRQQPKRTPIAQPNTTRPGPQQSILGTVTPLHNF